MQVLTAGTRMEQDQENGKPVQVTVVTLSVSPEQAERLALASTEGKIQLALRNPLDQARPRRRASRRRGCSASCTRAGAAQTTAATARARPAGR